MTDTYWEMGLRIVEIEQFGKKRADYGEKLLENLAKDLTKRFGCGFSLRNLRSFYQEWQIWQTMSAESSATNLINLAKTFPLTWSH